MRRLIPYFLIPICCFFGRIAEGQPTADTLLQVQNLKALGHVKQAEKLLNNWTIVNARTAEVIWLEAQIAYLRLKFSKSDRLYREAIAADPQNLYLKIDHAEALLNMGRFGDAPQILNDLSREEKRDAHALFVQAKYAYWTGDFREAEQLVSRALRADRTKPEALALAAEIRAASSLWLDLAATRMDDDQPLRKLEPRLSAGKYLHSLADLRVDATGAQFSTGESSPIAHQVGIANTMRLAKSGTTLTFGAGIFGLSGQGAGLTGGVVARQRLPEGLSLTTGFQRDPYTRNVTSLDTLVFENRVQVALDWQERHGFWIHAGGYSSTFGDANRVSSYWAWALSPPLGGRTWKFRTGYGFSYADSRESRFISDRPLAAWLDPFDPQAEITGVFAPYFTPQHMRVHQWIGNFSWSASKKLDVHINGAYGLWARAENPYLFLELDAGGELFINRDFLDMGFQPFELGGTLIYAISGRAQAKASYLFTRNFFYENQTVVLAVQLLLSRKT